MVLLTPQSLSCSLGGGQGNGDGGEEGDLGALTVRPGQAGAESLAVGGSLADWPSSGGARGGFNGQMERSPRRTHHWQHNGELAEGGVEPKDPSPPGPHSEDLKVSAG